jgi:TPR repeat protein
MSKVFISYKKVDKARADTIRRELRKLGVDTYIDLDLQSSSNYGFELNKQIDSAAAVVALWSASAIELFNTDDQNFFASEVDRGYARKVLVQVQLDPIKRLPLPYNTLQAPDISDWFTSGTRGDHEQWQNVLKTLGRFIKRPALPDLARTLANGGTAAKLEFVQQYPDDPSSAKIFEGLIADFRRDYDASEVQLRQTIDLRKTEAEELLREKRAKFEEGLAAFRKGQPFAPPDLKKSLSDEVNVLRQRAAATEVNATRAAERQRRLAVAAAVAGLLIGGGAAAAVTASIVQLGGGQAASAQRQETLDARERQLNIRAGSLDKSERELKTRQAELDASMKKLADDTGALKPQTTGSGAAAVELARREGELKQREAEVGKRSAALDQRQRDLDAQEQELKKKIAAVPIVTPNPEPAVSPQLQHLRGLAKTCDGMTALRGDPDRPANNEFKDNYETIDVPAATRECTVALKAANALTGIDVAQEKQITGRRLTMQIGRILAAESRNLANKGDIGGAKTHLEQALKNWNEAGNMGSGQAYALLAVFYRGKDFIIGPWQPKSDLTLSLRYYLKAADANHRPSMTNLGAALVGIEWDFKDTPWDAKEFGGMTREMKGKQLLDRARELGDARAYLISGQAVENVAGIPSNFKRVFGSDASLAERYLNIAYCNSGSVSSQMATEAVKMLGRINKTAPNCDRVEKLAQR